jgi:hypothetical protein
MITNVRASLIVDLATFEMGRFVPEADVGKNVARRKP